MIRALPAARSALSRLVLVILLLAGALCVLGAVSVDPARAASASVRDAGAAGSGGDRARAQGPTGRGTAESGQQPVRLLLRAAVVSAGAVVVPDPDTGPAGAATPVLPIPPGTAAGLPSRDVHRTGPTTGVSDRAPPRTAGT